MIGSFIYMSLNIYKVPIDGISAVSIHVIHACTCGKDSEETRCTCTLISVSGDNKTELVFDGLCMR